MDERNSWKKTQDKEIDLADLARRLCMRWKQAVLCAVAAVLIAGAYAYVKNRDYKAADSAGMEESELVQEEEQDVEKALLLLEETEELEQYLNQSVLMRVNPYRRNRTMLLYSISGASNRTQAKIAEHYLSFLSCGGVTSALKEADSKTWNMESRYLEELILVWQKSDSTYRMITDSMENEIPAETLFYVEITGEDARMAEKLAEAVQSALKIHFQEVKETCGRHELSLISCEESVKMDASLQAQQSDRKKLLETTKADLKSVTDSFDEQQKHAFEMKEAGNYEAGEKEGQKVSGISFKYVLLGFFAGLCVYGGIYICWYLFSDTVKSGREFRACYAVPFYGSVAFGKKSRRDRQKQHGPDGREGEQALNRIRFSCKRKNTGRVCLAAGFQPDSREREWLEGIARQLREQGTDTVIAEDIHADSSLWDVIADAQTAVMVEKTGIVTHSQIEKQMEFYLENEIAVLGAVILEGD